MNLAEQFTQGVTIATRVRVKLLERLRKMTAGESRTYCDLKVTRADDHHFAVGKEYVTLEGAVEMLADAYENGR